MKNMKTNLSILWEKSKKKKKKKMVQFQKLRRQHQ